MYESNLFYANIRAFFNRLLAVFTALSQTITLPNVYNPYISNDFSYIHVDIPFS